MLPLLITIAAVIFGFWWILNRNDGTPNGLKALPGPNGIPLFGNIFQVGSKMHMKFSQWVGTYGDIFQIRLGARKSVIVSDPIMVREILGDLAYSGRVFFEGFELYENEPGGIANVEGEMWEVHRRFALRHLRDFGFGKSTMEQLILEEVKEINNRFKQTEGQKVDSVKEMFLVAVINSLWMIVGSKRFSHDDPKLLQIISDGTDMLQQLQKRAVFFLVPWTRHFLPKMTKIDEVRMRGRQFYTDAVDEHKATYKDESIRDYIDAYLHEMYAQKDNPTSHFYGSRGERQLHAVLADLFFAGTETTSTTLAWGMLYLTKFKHVQQKFQEEITLVTDDTRCVSVSDRPSMPYTLALIEEILRYSSIVSTGVQRRAMVGKEYRGYYIPKDAWIFPNLHHIHHNPKIWGDPQNFRPERFLSDDGTFQRNKNLLAFQSGQRVCVGESLARDSIFLFLTNIFQRFSITLDPNSPEPTLEPQVSFINSPYPYSIILKQRENVIIS